ncbi:MAG: FAD-binding domain-containing protein [Xanthomonadales bacterium]|nr:FAD-binding domain-containing protein [Xanthomonadales bacterium]
MSEFNTVSGSAPWPATREAGLQRLQAFLPRAGRHYAAQRNFDHGPDRRDNVSGLSPYLTHRLLGEWEVALAAADSHGTGPAEKFIQEVCWRTYWKGWLEMRPQVWGEYLAELEHDRSQRPARDIGLDKATAGNTGIECFDAWARELVSTGYLHNHARMWFASIWIFTLKLPWTLGADFFYRNLLDGDAASNTLSWRWVAGLQTRGKHYLARPDNIAKYTGDRFPRPTGLNLDAEALEDTGAAPPARLDLPKAAAPADRWGLLLLDHDLMPESMPLPGPAVVAGCSTARLRGAEVSAPVISFSESAVADGVRRCQDHFGLDGSSCKTLSGPEAIADWTRHHRLNTVVCSYVPVGPMRDRLAELRQDLKDQGCHLLEQTRPWDETAWPFATKGFFPFKKKIGTILASVSV